jgi:hypothetical protein
MGQIVRAGIVVLLGVFAILSLIVAGGGHNDLQYWGGLGFFVLCVVLSFYAVRALTNGHNNRS